MSNLRQQRSVRNRRLTTLSTPAQVPTLAMSIVAIVGAEIDVQGVQYTNPPAPGANPLPLQLNGFPAILRVTGSHLPTNAILQPDGLTIRLSYGGGNVQPNERFIVPPFDPAIRTAQGGYLAQGEVAAPDIDAPAITYTATVQLDGTVTLVFDATPLGQTIVYGPFEFYNERLSSKNNSFTATPTGATIGWGAAANAGDTISYGPLPVHGNGVRIAYPSPTPVVVA